MITIKESTLIKILIPTLVVASVIYIFVDTASLANLLTPENWEFINIGKTFLNLLVTLSAGIIILLTLKNKGPNNQNIANRSFIGLLAILGFGVYLTFISMQDLIQGESYYTGSCEVYTDTVGRQQKTEYRVKFIENSKEVTIITSQERFNLLKGERLNSILANHYKCKFKDMKLTYLKASGVLLEAK